MLKTVWSFVVFLAAVDGQYTQISPCIWNAGVPLPIHTQLSDCVTLPCHLPQLQNAVIDMIFEAPYDVKTMKTVADVSMSLGGFPMPPFRYNLQEHGITCNFLQNTYCPLRKGEIVQYKLLMFIESFFVSGVIATCEFMVMDEQDSTPLTCARLSIMITEPLKP